MVKQARWGICDKAKAILQFPLSFGFGMLGKWFTNRTSVFEGTHYLPFALASIRIAARSMNQIDVGHYRFIIELNWISGTNCCLWIHVLFETVTEYLTIARNLLDSKDEEGCQQNYQNYFGGSHMRISTSAACSLMLVSCKNASRWVSCPINSQGCV